MMTFEELCASDRRVLALYQESKSPRPMTPDFCQYQFFHGLPGDRGLVGMKYLIKQNVPLEYQEMVLSRCRAVAPGCKHVDDGAMCPHNYPTPEPTPIHVEISVSDYLETTPEEKVGFPYSLKRDPAPAEVHGLLDRLRHAGNKEAK